MEDAFDIQEDTYRDMTEEHLGSEATANDLLAFVTACATYQEQTGCTDAEATDYVWDGGSWHPRVNVATPGHTPGPWTVDHERIGPPGEPVALLCDTTATEPGTVVEWPRFGEVVDDTENEANARLIASAPALLEALENLMDVEGVEPSTSPLQSYRDPDAQAEAERVWQQAFDAIAQAKGGA